ncbi:hypothetical protein H0I23_16265 [Cellulophaga sp. HaHaR_3_176]|uniref:hypothetical protein n=1 Tax=Cellulophaga sp. HaHaR_3_176 TaxID=1942464 RepID=UPI001C1F29EC|nr:hypothetical protein [Cellulophaga sp. HaHaR_3_176]QWX83981.1 hypothetical protein H0I23_16265 [Cellulophaga sp. HaHaR_3_176]
MEKSRNKNVVETKKYNSNVTEDDLQALGKKGLSMDTGDDSLLQDRKDNIDFTGEDLDVPGRHEVNLTPNLGLKDEENSLYGQGGESKDNLEEPERANLDKSGK